MDAIKEVFNNLPFKEHWNSKAKPESIIKILNLEYTNKIEESSSNILLNEDIFNENILLKPQLVTISR